MNRRIDERYDWDETTSLRRGRHQEQDDTAFLRQDRAPVREEPPALRRSSLRQQPRQDSPQLREEPRASRREQPHRPAPRRVSYGPAGVRTHGGLRPGTVSPERAGGPARRALAAVSDIALGRKPGEIPKPPSTRKLVISAAVVVLLWGDSVLVGGLLAPPQPIRVAALGLHLATMILGLGAVLMLDHAGLQFMFGKKPFTAVIDMTADTHLPIWVGYGGLLLSGAFLAPSLSKPIVMLKMLLVLGCGLGGVNAMRLTGKAHQWMANSEPGSKPPMGLVLQTLIAGSISQVCWWGAFTVGMISPYVR